MSAELVSTRDGEEAKVKYTEALLAGLAPDGGLFTPYEIPTIDRQTLYRLSKMTYIDLFVAVKSLFVGRTITIADQKLMAEAAFTQDKFPGVIDGNFMPVNELEPGFFIQDLSRGPTAAFKDAALQPLGQELNHVLNSNGNSLRMLGATSGDTGSAAEAAVKGLAAIKLFMLSPAEGMSEFQRAQMGMLSGDNIHNISVLGRFDDCQDLVKELKSDPEFADLGAVNSINWGRISSQISYYFSGYFQAIGEKLGDPVDFVVPTGNFGNILAGYFAREMGLPIRKLIVATNENNVMDDVIQKGVYMSREAKITSSPSMDISKSSNFERLVYYLLGGDPMATAKYMRSFDSRGTVSFSDFGLPGDIMKQIDFDSGSSSHQSRLDNIRWAYNKHRTVIDPHTADAVAVARRFRTQGVPIVCMSTAHPVKFEDTIKEALGFVPIREERFEGIEGYTEDAFTVIQPEVEALKNYIRANS